MFEMLDLPILASDPWGFYGNGEGGDMPKF